jgi:Fe-S-cluster-containing dehydrogenase component/DMSO reductase anchor subunit
MNLAVSRSSLMTDTAVTLPLTAESSGKRVRRLPLLDQLLREQQTLSAVERFSQRHADATSPLQEPFYRALLPASPPGPGQQYSFDVNLDVCTGCKACVAACHSLNGLDEGETWRSVGLLHGGSLEAPMQKTVTTACHHCVDPACMKGCPVDAYEKDPVTGIVRHLDDQCIGCQYCTLTCPYEVPQYNAKLGIVRKCDMCSDRLSQGEAPACVQACPNSAIAIRVIDIDQAIEDAQSNAFLPGAPSPGITVPTTVYRTAGSLPRNMLPADFYAVLPAHRHTPLVIMLVLTQLSAGSLLIDQLLGQLLNARLLAALRPLHAPVALALGLLALGASTLHLGRPQYAWRALIGLRTSWMSREILAFGLFAGTSSLYALSVTPLRAALLPAPLAAALGAASPALGASAAGIGMLSVFCSVMLYQVTHRAWWSGGRTAFKFFGTALVLGTATLLATSVAGLASVSPFVLHLAEPGCTALLVLVTMKVCGELAVLGHLRDKQQGDLKRSALLLTSHLAGAVRWRLVTALLGGIVAPLACRAALATQSSAAALTWAISGLLLLVASELFERSTFFSALSAPRMPGGFG